MPDIPTQAGSQPPAVYNMGNQLHPNVALTLLDSDLEIDFLANHLRGKKFVVSNTDTGEGTWEMVAGESVVNEKGIHIITTALKVFSSKAISLSNKDEYSLLRDLRLSGFALNQELFLNYRTYGLQPKHYKQLYSLLFTYMQYCIFRAKGGAWTEFVHPKYGAFESIQTIKAEQLGQQQGGFFSRFLAKK